MTVHRFTSKQPPPPTGPTLADFEAAVALIRSVDADIVWSPRAGGGMDQAMSAEDLYAVSVDEHRFIAATYGATIEQVRAWATHDEQCTGTRKDGRRCRAASRACGACLLPHQFVAGVSDRCHLHQAPPVLKPA